MHVVILNSSPSEKVQAQSMLSGQSLPEVDHEIKKVNKLHDTPYEKFYEALKDLLKLIAHVLHTRKSDNIKLISTVVRIPAIQHQN